MKPCGYCGSSSMNPFLSGVTDRLRQDSGSYSFVACQGCGSSWLEPLPSPQEIEAAYPEVYGLGKGGALKSPLARALQALELALWLNPVYRRNVRILSRFHGAGQGELLDVGCGSGYQTACFKAAGWKVTGLDFAPGAGRMMKERHGIEAFECNASNMAEVLGDRQFDVITLFHVIEHAPDPDTLISGVCRHLRRGGTIFLSAPLAGSIQAALFGRHWGAYREAPRHVSLPSASGLMRLLERQGFSGITYKPDHVFYVAGSALVSLVSSLTMTSSYGRSGFAAAVKRVVGAGLAISYMPAAFIETFSRRCSLGLVLGRR